MMTLATIAIILAFGLCFIEELRDKPEEDE